MTRHLRPITIGGVLLAALAAATGRGEAHKPMTSKYTYNDDVFPIFRDKCGRCHVDGGVAPMSLTTYKDALPWNESVRAEIIAGHMPPVSGLNAKEMDTVLTWASGGNPEGNPARVPLPVTLARTWPLGAPDIILDLPSDVSLPAGTSEETRSFTVATGTTEPRWIRAADLLPGTPSMVRNAVISLPSRGAVLALWTPGDDPHPAPDGAAFLLPAGAAIDVRIHYKKVWKNEAVALSDRSRIGLYFAAANQGAAAPRELLALSLAPVAGAPGTFSRVMDEDVRAFAMYPDPAASNIVLNVTAVAPDGTRASLGHLLARPGWVRRSWFDQPVLLPRATRLEVTATTNPTDRLLPPAATPLMAGAASQLPVSVTFDVVSAAAR